MASTEKVGETTPKAEEQVNETVPTTELPVGEKDEAEDEEDKESDWEDLDDVLDDFNKPKQAANPKTTVAGSSSSSSNRPTQDTLGIDDLDEEELMRQFEAEMMANLLGQNNRSAGKAPTAAAATGANSKLPNTQSPMEHLREQMEKKGLTMDDFQEEMDKNGVTMQDIERELEDLSKTLAPHGMTVGELLNRSFELEAAENEGEGSVADAQRAAAAATTAAGGGGNFQHTIQETLKRMQESGDKATAAATNLDDAPDEVLEKFMKLLDVGVAGGDGGAEGLEEMFTGIIKDISNKEMLYEPMKDYDAKYGPWLEANKGKVSAEDFARYENQARIVKEIVDKFDEEGYSDENPDCRAYIWEHMQQMEAAGAPPEEVIANPLMPNISENMDNDQVPPECNPQ